MILRSSTMISLVFYPVLPGLAGSDRDLSVLLVLLDAYGCDPSFLVRTCV